MRIVCFHARMNLPKFACYRLLSTMPKVKLVDSKCIEKGVLYCLLRCLLPTRRIIPARKRLFRTWVSTWAYHGIIFLHVICWAPCEFGMWCHLHDLKIATKANHWLDQFLLSQFGVVSRKRVGLFVIFMLPLMLPRYSLQKLSKTAHVEWILDISVLHCRLGLGVQPTVATGRRRESKEWFERRHCDGQQGWNQKPFRANVLRKCQSQAYSLLHMDIMLSSAKTTLWKRRSPIEPRAAKKRVGHCRLFCFQEGAPKAAPKFVSKMRACAKVFKCLCGVRWSVNGGCGCTCSKGQGPRNMYEYVDCFNVFLIIFIYFSSCLGVNVVMIEFFYPRFALSLICDIQPWFGGGVRLYRSRSTLLFRFF